MSTHSYTTQRFRQRKSDGLETVLFVATAEEIAKWAGVPQKSSRFMKGFQRADNTAHWQDISKFFETPGNISPTAIVVAFKPGRARLEEKKSLLVIDYEEMTNRPVSELAAQVVSELEQFEATEDQPKEDGGAPQEEADGEEDDEDDEEGVNADPSEVDALKVQGSHLSQFLTLLRDPIALEQARQEDEDKLRDMLLNLLKPATIVDGQHRTRGAAFLEQGIQFPVVGLLDADWREQVFQFVVINQRARPIPAEFLSAIISSSLNSDDIRKMSQRLEQAGVRLDNTRIMDLVNGDSRSPFRGMIDFKVQGSHGRLPYPGTLTLARRFRGLRTHDREVRFAAFFKTVFQGGVPGAKYSDRRAGWNNAVWFTYFSAFWQEVREHLCDKAGGYEHLWAYGTNLLKIVALQELQNLFLQWVSDRRDPVTSEEELRATTQHFIANLRPIFFEKEWKLPSLQSGTGRQYLREGLNAALKKPKFDYKVPLFTGVKASK